MKNSEPGADEYLERFQELQQLGKGTYGVVLRVEEKTTGTIFAGKHIKLRKAEHKARVLEEISILEQMCSPYIIQFIAAYHLAREIILVMEYLDGGELFERVADQDFTLTESECTAFLRQICSGVEYIHHQNIIHLDLKPENVVCINRKQTDIKIIDFGLARRITPDKEIKAMCGTVEFIAPEIVNYDPLSTATDIWAIGVISYILLSGLSPFLGDTDMETYSNINRVDYYFPTEEFSAISEAAKDFIRQIFIRDPTRRMTAEQCLDHSWLKRKQHKYTRINTVSLRKYVIRRRWLRAGRAIIAAYRMSVAVPRKSSSACSLSTNYSDSWSRESLDSGRSDVTVSMDKKRLTEDFPDSVPGTCFLSCSTSSSPRAVSRADSGLAEEECEDDDKFDDSLQNFPTSNRLRIGDTPGKSYSRSMTKPAPGTVVQLRNAITIKSGPPQDGGHQDGARHVGSASSSSSGARLAKKTATRPQPGSVKQLIARFDQIVE